MKVKVLGLFFVLLLAASAVPTVIDIFRALSKQPEITEYSFVGFGILIVIMVTVFIIKEFLWPLKEEE